MNEKYNIAIVGGGIVGLLTSLSLSKLGFSIIHVERDSITVKDDTRSLAVSYSSIAFLNTLNLWEHISHKTCTIKKVHISDKGHYGRAEIKAEDESLPFLGAIIEMKTLLEVALKQVELDENITKAFNTNVDSITKENNEYILNVTSKDSNQTQIKADLFIACDGANSSIRQHLNIEAETTDYGQNAVVFDITTELPNNHTAYERFISEGVFALLPKGSNAMACVWTVDREQTKNLMSLSDDVLLEKMQDKFGYRLGEIQSISKPQSFPLYLVQAKEMYRDNVLLFGNALHFLHPVSGQGLNLSIRDIGCLYDLLDGIDISNKVELMRVLRKFVELRDADHKRTIKVTHSFIQWFVSDKLSLKFFRNTGLHLLQRSKLGKKVLGRVMMGKLSGSSTLMRKVVDND
jgi:2-octaprenyl-6-methoxyphenol hydroxylase